MPITHFQMIKILMMMTIIKMMKITNNLKMIMTMVILLKAPKITVMLLQIISKPSDKEMMLIITIF